MPITKRPLNLSTTTFWKRPSQSAWHFDAFDKLPGPYGSRRCAFCCASRKWPWAWEVGICRRFAPFLNIRWRCRLVAFALSRFPPLNPSGKFDRISPPTERSRQIERRVKRTKGWNKRPTSNTQHRECNPWTETVNPLRNHFHTLFWDALRNQDSTLLVALLFPSIDAMWIAGPDEVDASSEEWPGVDK